MEYDQSVSQLVAFSARSINYFANCESIMTRVNPPTRTVSSRDIMEDKSSTVRHICISFHVCVHAEQWPSPTVNSTIIPT